MSTFNSRFEQIWTAVFLGLYFFIMLPFSWFYSEQYIPGLWGIPTYLLGWLLYAIIVLFLIAIFSHQSQKQQRHQCSLLSQHKGNLNDTY